MTVFKIIAALDESNGYSTEDLQMPWNNPDDLKFFKNKTLGSAVLMGHNTWKSIREREFSNRINIVLGNFIDKVDKKDKLYFVSSIEQAFILLNSLKTKECYVIGGAILWNEFLDRKLINYMYITRIQGDFLCSKIFNLDANKRVIKDFTRVDKIYSEYNNLTVSEYSYTNKEEKKVLDTINKICTKGCYKMDRSGVGTKSLFGKTFSYDIRNYRLPLFTHRKIFLRGITEELLFFISGKTNTKVLEEKKVNIWQGHTSKEYLDKIINPDIRHMYSEGSYGPAYGFQLRHWGADFEGDFEGYTNKGFDQLQYVINLLKTNKTSRRILFSYWNPSVLDKVPLPSCHLLYNFFVDIEKNELSVSFYQRSNDFALAAAFNVCSATLLVFMLCKITGLKPGKCVHTICDLHVYVNQIEYINEFSKNSADINYPIVMVEKKDNIEDYKVEDFKVMFYNSHKKYHIPFNV